MKPDLWDAVERGDYVIVDQLLTKGCDIEEKYKGWTSLMKAAEEGHVEIMKSLLERDADIAATNNKGRTALSFAACPSQKRTTCLLYTSPSPRDATLSRMPSSA